MGVICRIALFQTKSQPSCSLPGFNYLSFPTSEEKSSTFKNSLMSVWCLRDSVFLYWSFNVQKDQLNAKTKDQLTLFDRLMRRTKKFWDFSKIVSLKTKVKTTVTFVTKYLQPEADSIMPDFSNNSKITSFDFVQEGNPPNTCVVYISGKLGSYVFTSKRTSVSKPVSSINTVFKLVL